jgi:hypothetical protein
LLGIGIGVFLIHCSGEGRSAEGGLHVYFFNPEEGRLQGVSVSIPAGEPVARLDAMLTRFYNPPASLTGLWPKGMPLVEMHYIDGLAGIALPREFAELPIREAALFRTALTLSFTEYDFVERVLFWIVGTGDKPSVPFARWLSNEDEWDRTAIRVESRQTVANNPTITPGSVHARTITLYFVCADGLGLVTETFVDEYMDTHRLAEFKLLHLIAGPEGENAMRIIPPETRVRSTSHDEDTRRLYVDLSGDFASRFIGSPHLARLMLQSIVNTLTLRANNPGRGPIVNEVYFFIDSERLAVFHGVSGFDQAFTYNHDIMLVSEIPEDPDPYEENGNGDDG